MKSVNHKTERMLQFPNEHKQHSVRKNMHACRIAFYAICCLPCAALGGTVEMHNDMGAVEAPFNLDITYTAPKGKSFDHNVVFYSGLTYKVGSRVGSMKILNSSCSSDTPGMTTTNHRSYSIKDAVDVVKGELESGSKAEIVHIVCTGNVQATKRANANATNPLMGGMYASLYKKSPQGYLPWNTTITIKSMIGKDLHENTVTTNHKYDSTVFGILGIQAEPFVGKIVYADEIRSKAREWKELARYECVEGKCASMSIDIACMGAVCSTLRYKGLTTTYSDGSGWGSLLNGESIQIMGDIQQSGILDGSLTLIAEVK